MASRSSKYNANPFSTGQGGADFENEVQTMFAALMLTRGEIKWLPDCFIEKIKFQTKVDGYQTDDMLIFCRGRNTKQKRRVLIEIKHAIRVTKSSRDFAKVMKNAWLDYNDSALFTPNNDALALITGPLGMADIAHTRTILEWAKTEKNAEEYFRKVKKTYISSNVKRGKLEVIQHHLRIANGGESVAEENLFTFLRHFHIIPSDLDNVSSLNFSLLSTLLSERSHVGPRELWARMAEEVGRLNRAAGTADPDCLGENLKGILKPLGRTMPQSYLPAPSEAEQDERTHYDYARHLALANLLGMWDENSNINDRIVIEQLVGESYNEWIVGLRRFLNLSNSPVSFQEGRWHVKDRKKSWKTHGRHLGDDNLETFKKCALEILKRRDPAFDLPPNQRYAANIYGKVLPHSHNFRKGIAESLALMGTQPEALQNCSKTKREIIALLTVDELLSDAEPEIWGSLNELLPDLAEAAPAEFLKAVERGFRQNPCPFDFLFAQESEDFVWTNCHTGLLRSLEVLAWDEEYLSASCALLGQLSKCDPGGQICNRPANSLLAILMPWCPQTLASFEKQKTALQVLIQEVPDEAWKLILGLLPDPLQNSFGTCKPLWRDIVPVDWKEQVSYSEYWARIAFYAECAVEMSVENVKRLSELLRCLDKLPKETLERFLDILSSEEITKRPEADRRDIWESLDAVVRKHIKFSDADWALDAKVVESIERVAEKLKPQDVMHVYRNLFGKYDADLYDQAGDYKEQHENLIRRRKRAVKEIFEQKGVEAVLNFAKSVEQPLLVGGYLGDIGNAGTDKRMLPSLLGTENQSLHGFVCNYVWHRREICGWKWVDQLNMSGWTRSQIAHLLSGLPFTFKTWEKAADYLGVSGREYWMITPTLRLEENERYDIAIDKLNECGRHDAAIDCLWQVYNTRQKLDVSRTVQTLLKAAQSEETVSRLDTYEITSLIKVLRDHPAAKIGDVIRVEWAYLPLLDHYYQDTSPIALEKQLGVVPDFFCKVIRLLYRSEHEQKSQRANSKKDRNKAKYALRLLHNWRIPPGVQSDGTFSFNHFSRWLEQVRKICTESGHLKMALTHVGEILFYCPPDPDGAWINRQVAELLNGTEAEAMRKGFMGKILNSRGAHRVRPSGEPERKLAAHWREKAEFIEQEGWRRFSEVLKNVAQHYEHEAQRIVDEHEDQGS